MTTNSRRDFGARLGTAAAGLAAGTELLGTQTVAAQSGRILGANDRVVLANIGIRGQGNALERGFARLPNVEIKTLCDIDANLAPERINDERLKDVPTFKPGFVQDLRRVLDDKDIDGIIIAAPNHWHALATILGAAGRQARLSSRSRRRTRWSKAAACSKRRHARDYGDGDTGNQGRTSSTPRAGDSTSASIL